MTGVLEVVIPAIVEPSEFELRERTLTPPGPDQVTLRMEATGVSFAEQQMRRGRYYDQPAFPFVGGYDLVGTVVAGAEDLLGQRFAVVTKTGGWSSLVNVPVSDLLPVPADADAAEVETLIVNGITAWQMLHTSARVAAGGTVVVLGANGGVGNLLVQLAVTAGLRVIGTASPAHHELVRSLGAEVVDYRDPELYSVIQSLAPDGVDAVFDHVGGPGLVESWRLLRRGGTLVSYGSASTMHGTGSAQLPMLQAFARVVLWNTLPNGRHASLYDFWAGRRRRETYIARQQDALGNLLRLVAVGAVRPQVAARIPLSQIVRAVELAESRTVAGKVVVVADE
ncbi:NADPH:quinone reductase [Glaciihabitans arcticus]|uniref:NADPH:quinone reductase n=1 Tax=Glaciihabitans arcticus TaxID=2668039 RepID=A0A4Q9GSE6_9MICO|nr:zinc-binding dehydrogenase [Glaciihabitans arcticus]TBN57922.1 NADPH:quinone reductase [Glaciihabitans arcticus]